jgi:hypothetical protein
VVSARLALVVPPEALPIDSEIREAANPPFRFSWLVKLRQLSSHSGSIIRWRSWPRPGKSELFVSG